MVRIHLFKKDMLYDAKAPNTAWTRTPATPATSSRGRVRRGCRGGSLRTPFGQSGSLRGSKLVPSKRRCLVPPTSTPQKRAGHIPLGKFTLGDDGASRWAF
jgi:hypothetical protein